MSNGILLPPFEFEAPSTVGQVCSMLAEAGVEASVLGGGTDLLVKMKRGELAPRLLISLGRLADLRGIEISGSSVAIGPMTTMRELAQHDGLGRELAGLADAAAGMGGPLIRARATIGGNIVNARPCADTLPPLISLGARLRLARKLGCREVALDGFVRGPGETCLGPDELLVGLEVPREVDGKVGSSYIKITRRAAMEITLVGCAASVVLNPQGTQIRAGRVVLASVAPIPLRVREAETALQGATPCQALFAEVASAAQRAAEPIDDHRAPADYRKAVVSVITERALRMAVERARGRPF